MRGSEIPIGQIVIAVSAMAAGRASRLRRDADQAADHAAGRAVASRFMTCSLIFFMSARPIHTVAGDDQPAERDDRAQITDEREKRA